MDKPSKFSSIREATEYYRAHPLLDLNMLQNQPLMERLARCTHEPEEQEYLRSIELPAIKACILEYLDCATCPSQFIVIIEAIVKAVNEAESSYMTKMVMKKLFGLDL